MSNYIYVIIEATNSLTFQLALPQMWVNYPILLLKTLASGSTPPWVAEAC